jgi:hypothetical protein
MRLTRTTFDEVSRLWKFLSEIDLLSQVTSDGYYSVAEAISDEEISEDDLTILRIENGCDEGIERSILKQIFSFISGDSRYQCAMFNLDTLLRNCVDLDSDALEFSHAIRNGLDMLEKASKKLIDPEDPSISC